MIVPGGGISLDGTRWVACRPNFFLYVGVLSRLFRRLVLEKLAAAHGAGALQFFGKHASRATGALRNRWRRQGLRGADAPGSK
jgi:Putative transposase